MRRITLEDLPEGEEGQYGWCLHENMDTNLLELVYHDDDDYWCSHKHDETDPEHECSRKTKCYLDSGALVRPHPRSGRHSTAPYSLLHQFPAEICHQYPSTRHGWVYAIALMPDVSLHRLKIGFTERSVWGRLDSFRTANPSAVLVGMWDGDRSDESLAHTTIDGRIRQTEVFDVADPVAALVKLSRALLKPRTA